MSFFATFFPENWRPPQKGILHYEGVNHLFHKVSKRHLGRNLLVLGMDISQDLSLQPLADSKITNFVQAEPNQFDGLFRVMTHSFNMAVTKVPGSAKKQLPIRIRYHPPPFPERNAMRTISAVPFQVVKEPPARMLGSHLDPETTEKNMLGITSSFGVRSNF